jgi:hypothetical protein
VARVKCMISAPLELKTIKIFNDQRERQTAIDPL